MGRILAESTYAQCLGTRGGFHHIHSWLDPVFVFSPRNWSTMCITTSPMTRDSMGLKGMILLKENSHKVLCQGERSRGAMPASSEAKALLSPLPLLSCLRSWKSLPLSWLVLGIYLASKMLTASFTLFSLWQHQVLLEYFSSEVPSGKAQAGAGDQSSQLHW